MPEDGDTEDHPNIFLMPKSQNSGFSPRLREIKDNFPMPGTYHFRFKTPLIPGSDREKNAVSVWMDCVDDDQHVGVWRNTIVAKVTRINMEEADDYDDFGSNRQQQQQQHRAATTTINNARSNSSQHQPLRHTAPPPAPAPVQVPASDNLLGFDAPPSRKSFTCACVGTGERVMF